ncbi:hypothetical protein B0H19DRAFT_1235332 [Mycena capillaripes]|nr:hypothetical protein B0H19DRAFT_1235332 [Mycena capillaripes]
MARAHQRPNKRNVGGPTLLVVSLLHPPTHQQDSNLVKATILTSLALEPHYIETEGLT